MRITLVFVISIGDWFIDQKRKMEESTLENAVIFFKRYYIIFSLSHSNYDLKLALISL